MTEPGPAPLPPAVVDQHARLTASRRAARRVLARGRMRRRVVPPLVVGSGVLIGSSAIATWVHGQVGAAGATAARSAATPTTVPPGVAQLSADVVALQRVRQALATDEAAITALSSPGAGSAPSGTPAPSAGTGTAPSPSSPGPSAHVGSSGAGAPGSGTTPAPAAPGAAPSPGVPAPAATGGPAPLPAFGPLPTIPVATVPTTTAPPTHTTTGATTAVP